MIGVSTISVYVCMVAVGILGPVILALIWKKKTGEPLSTVFVGALIFFVFAIVLETLPKLVLFQTNNPVGVYVMARPLLYMTLAALLAGIFEETGRFVAFRFLLKKRTDRRTAISYGIGHGGLEAMYLLALGGIQYISYALIINAGQFDTLLAQAAAAAPEQVEALQAIPQSLAATTFANLFLSVWERTSAVLIHLSCSVLVFCAVRQKRKGWLFPLAILLHASIDMVAALYQLGVITNLYVLELCLFIWAAGFFAICMKCVYRKLRSSGGEIQEQI